MRKTDLFFMSFKPVWLVCVNRLQVYITWCLHDEACSYAHSLAYIAAYRFT